MAELLILLVEDNPDDVKLTQRAFERANVANRVVVVNDGVEALEWLHCTGAYAARDPQEVPQVVLLDLKLPRMGGLEVLERIRGDARTELLPVVILTSSEEERDLAEGYRLRANSYVRKPVDFRHFTEAAQQLGLYWLIVNAPPPGARR